MEYNRILVLAVGSQIMIDVLKRFTYLDKCFVDHGGDFIWARNGIYCKCHDVDQVKRCLVDKNSTE